MTRSLAFKLTVSFWLVSIIGVTLVAIFAVLATNNEYVTLQDERLQKSVEDRLSSYYAATGSWQGVDDTLARLQQNVEMPFVLADVNRNVILPGMGFDTKRPLPGHMFDDGTPIEVDGEVVGKLIFPRSQEFQTQRDPNKRVGGNARPNIFNPEVMFLQRINRAVLWAAGGATAVSLAIGFFLARTLTKPIHELKQATQAVAQGNLGQQVEIHSQDELGNLAESFNQMSTDLLTAQNQRRQLTADIAHDLRTPLSLILGHSEALSDGVLPATPETLDIIHDEAMRLNRLIDDLRTLSLAEAGKLRMMMRPIHSEELVERTAIAYLPAAQEKQIAVEKEIQAAPEVLADPDRISQVLDNLMDNAIRHTPQGGKISIRTQSNANDVQLSVQDSGVGIAAVDLPHVFSRFYRADKSRHRHDGGSGLGLAIARSIVEQHNGRIWVESILGQGTTFHFTLPQAT
ncbi:MAG: HAMP domain-containing protein [Chloroflexi bacterium]|nr:MAG: HAMP domain-containing protein [Chloroflexota bacterium]